MRKCKIFVCLIILTIVILRYEQYVLINFFLIFVRMHIRIQHTSL